MFSQSLTLPKNYSWVELAIWATIFNTGELIHVKPNYKSSSTWTKVWGITCPAVPSLSDIHSPWASPNGRDIQECVLHIIYQEQKTLRQKKHNTVSQLNAINNIILYSTWFNNAENAVKSRFHMHFAAWVKRLWAAAQTSADSIMPTIWVW